MTNPSYKYRRAPVVTANTTISFLLSPAEFNAVDQAARKLDISRSELIRRLIKEFVKEGKETS